ncbi:MAG: mechanosensitive ion channel [Dehalococcoidia bacterium]|nr:mechanosensitive ion channel [Dehalococcoidia bacterium]
MGFRIYQFTKGFNLNTVSIISLLLVVSSTLGVSVVLKDFVLSIIAGFIIRWVKHVKPGRRIKIMSGHNIKGDVVSVGPLRTTLAEVGDGEHLPSIRTGRLIKVTNSMIIDSAVLLYGEDIIDEVIAWVNVNTADVDAEVRNMKESIVSVGHELVEVGLFQKEDRLIVHGVFKVRTSEIADERTKILLEFLRKRKESMTPKPLKDNPVVIPQMYQKQAQDISKESTELKSV